MAFRQESYDMFDAMIQSIEHDTVQMLFRIKVTSPMERQQTMKPLEEGRGGEDGASKTKTVVRKEKKVGRNDPCPCGSGKKYKNCCGRQA